MIDIKANIPVTIIFNFIKFYILSHNNYSLQLLFIQVAKSFHSANFIYHEISRKEVKVILKRSKAKF